MANQYAVVNLDKVQSAYVGNIASVQHSATLENGSLINLGALVATENELYAVGTPATATLTSEEILLVASDEVIYQRYNTDGTIATKGDFINAANKPAKAYHLAIGDEFSITDDGFSGTPVVGKFLIPANGALIGAIADDLTGGTRFAAKVVAIGLTSLTYNGDSATRFRVVKV